LQQAVTVGNGYRADRSQVVVIALASGSNDGDFLGDSELDGEGAYAAGGRVDEQGLTGLDAKFFQDGVCGAAGSRE
jgi:hypothetical protein